MDSAALNAIKEGNAAKLDELLKRSNNIYGKDAENQTLLHIAMTRNNVAVVQAILDNLARDKLKEFLNAKATGSTALHIAAQNNFYEQALLLLQYGANYEAKNNIGKKPISLTSNIELRKALELIDKNFAKVGHGYQLTGDLQECHIQVFTAVMNCRSDKGRTLMQEILCHHELKVLQNLLMLRSQRLQKPIVIDLDHKDDIDMVAETIKQFHRIWYENRQILMMVMEISLRQCAFSESYQTMFNHFGIWNCHQTLEKAHEVLLVYQRIEGKEKTLTTNPMLKILEEIFEVLGFNPDELCINVGKEECYYEHLEDRFRNGIGKVYELLDNIIEFLFLFMQKTIFILQLLNEGHRTEKVERLKDKKVLNDCSFRSVLSYAAQTGKEKYIRKLLESDRSIVDKDNTRLSPVYLAVSNDHTDVAKLLLKHVNSKNMAEFIDRPGRYGNTNLHKAAKRGNLDMVKTLLKYGATYWIFNENGSTPADESKNQKVVDFLKLVDDCFYDAKEGDTDLVYKLKAMQKDEFIAVASARNSQGNTLAVEAAKAGAKNIASVILKMMKEAKEDEK